MDVDDIYGDDLLGGAPAPQPEAQQPAAQSLDGQAAPTNVPQARDIGSMSPDEIKSALQEWEHTFQEERKEGGAFSGIIGNIQPLTVLNELRRALASEQQARAEVMALRQRLAMYAAESAARLRDDVVLRKELLAARTASDPSVLQLRQLLLEPAINREFNRLSAATATATMEATALKNEMKAMHEFANNPQGPRMLTAQIKTLEEKIEAMEKAAEESEVARLERALEMAKAQLEEMRHQYGELEDHTHSLEDEVEALQRDLAAERRSAANAIAAASAGGAPHAAAGPAHPPPPGPPHYRDHHPRDMPFGGGGGGGPGRGRGMHPPLPQGPPGGGGGEFHGRGPPPGMMKRQRGDY